MGDVFVYRDMTMEYSNKVHAGSPHTHYPEYPYQELSDEDNNIYDSVRQLFVLSGLDEQHYGTASWNPLGEYVKPKDVVLVKPNMVIHQNVKKATERNAYTPMFPLLGP